MEPKDIQQIKCKIEPKLDKILANLSEMLESHGVSEPIDVSVEFKVKVIKPQQMQQRTLTDKAKGDLIELDLQPISFYCVLNPTTGNIECGPNR